MISCVLVVVDVERSSCNSEQVQRQARREEGGGRRGEERKGEAGTPGLRGRVYGEGDGQRGEAVIRDGPAPSRAVSRRWAAAAAPNARTNARTRTNRMEPHPQIRVPIVAVSPLGTAHRDRQHTYPGHRIRTSKGPRGCVRPILGTSPGARSASASPHAA